MSESSYIHAGDRFVMLRPLEDGSVAPVLMEVCHELHSSHAPGRSCGTALYRVDPEVWPNQSQFSENVNMSNREVREYINNHSPELFLQERVRELMEDLDDAKTQIVEGSQWAHNAWGYLRETAGVHDGRIDVDEPHWAKQGLSDDE